MQNYPHSNDYTAHTQKLFSVTKTSTERSFTSEASLAKLPYSIEWLSLTYPYRSQHHFHLSCWAEQEIKENKKKIVCFCHLYNSVKDPGKPQLSRRKGSSTSQKGVFKSFCLNEALEKLKIGLCVKKEGHQCRILQSSWEISWAFPKAESVVVRLTEQ